MSSDAGGGFTFLVLIADEAEAVKLARFLEDSRLRAGRDASNFVIPPVRGLAFFAGETYQAELDRWWAAAVPNDAHPVYVVMHEEGLRDWIAGIDGSFYIGVGEQGMASQYAGMDGAHAFMAAGILDLAGALMADFAGPAGSIFDPGQAARLSSLSGGLLPRFGLAASPSPAPVVNPPGLPAGHPLDDAMWRGRPSPAGSFADDSFDDGPVDVEPRPTDRSSPCHPFQNIASLAGPDSTPGSSALGPDPFDLLISSQPQIHSSPPEAATGVVGPAPAEVIMRRHRSLSWRGRRSVTPAPNRELAAAMVGRGPTIAVIGSRKGGVGKTSHAAGIAIVAGEVLDLFGHRAAIVDANIANPDAWGQLNLPAGAATVREMVAALTANREPPPPVHSSSPALACYPESREAGDYSRTDVDRLAAYLRRRYTFIVVDMSNRLPDPLAGPEAAAAAYWLRHADVLVLPTASSKQDFNGVLDYLDVRGRPPTVVPYIVPGDRRNRDHPVTRQYLAAISQRVQCIVPIPDEADKVRYAGMEGVPVQQVSSNLAIAYRELMDAIVRVPLRSPEREP
ncbi:MAG: hypothetical protein ABR564_00140 [Candidatus Dormibacteria bacterium]